MSLLEQQPVFEGARCMEEEASWFEVNVNDVAKYAVRACCPEAAKDYTARYSAENPGAVSIDPANVLPFGVEATELASKDAKYYEATAGLTSPVKLITERHLLQIPPIMPRPKPNPNQGILFDSRSIL